MANKTLRILIADALPQQRMQVEKMLNQLGYFRIAPVATLDELLALVQGAVQPFDLLIANTELASRAGVDLQRFCRDSGQVRHALLYQVRHPGLPQNLADGGLSLTLARLPDVSTLRRFMDAVDAPPSPREPRKDPVITRGPRDPWRR